MLKTEKADFAILIERQKHSRKTGSYVVCNNTLMHNIEIRGDETAYMDFMIKTNCANQFLPTVRERTVNKALSFSGIFCLCH